MSTSIPNRTVHPDERPHLLGAASRLPDDPLQRARRRIALTFAIFLGAVPLLVGAVLMDLADAWACSAVVGYGLLGYAALLVVVARAQLGPRDERRFALAHVMFGISLISLAYALVDVAHATALQMLCLIIVFEVRRLSIRQTVVAAAAAASLPALGLTLRWWISPQGLDIRHELLYLGLASVAAPVLIMASLEARAVRRRKAAQRDRMATALERLRQLSVYDNLTGAFNRSHMTELLAAELKRQSRDGHPACLALLDVDHFKRVNDSWGHGKGDQALQRVAEAVLAAVQGTGCSFARWGGEEFLLLMPDLPRRQAETVIQSVLAAIREADWSMVASGVAITVSAGVVETSGAMTPAQAVDAADQALYRAKAAGRNCAVWADAAGPDPEDPAARRAPPASKAVVRPMPASSLSEAAVAAATPADVPASVASTASTGWLARALDLILTTDHRTRMRLRLCLVVSGVYLTTIAATLLFPLPTHLLSTPLARMFTVMELLGAVVPYCLVRSGITRTWSDPALVVPQTLWACTALVVGYALVPVARAYNLQLLCVTLVFGFIDFRPQQCIVVGRVVIAMLVAAYVAAVGFEVDGFSPALEGLRLPASVGALAMMTLLSTNFARTRGRVEEATRALEATTVQINERLRVDPLTGLWNRQHMQALLDQACLRHAERGAPFAVVLVDLDHFKQVNDTRGHRVGDEVLMNFARIARSVLRGTDLMARWGGEEFLLLLPDIESDEQAVLTVQRLHTALVGQSLCAEPPALERTFSAGLARHRLGEPVAELVERADVALYRAKARGRARTEVATSVEAASVEAVSPVRAMEHRPASACH